MHEPRTSEQISFLDVCRQFFPFTLFKKNVTYILYPNQLKPLKAGTASRSRKHDNESEPIWVKHKAELFHIISTVTKKAVKLKFADWFSLLLISVRYNQWVWCLPANSKSLTRWAVVMVIKSLFTSLHYFSFFVCIFFPSVVLKSYLRLYCRKPWREPDALNMRNPRCRLA